MQLFYYPPTNKNCTKLQKLLSGKKHSMACETPPPTPSPLGKGRGTGKLQKLLRFGLPFGREHFVVVERSKKPASTGHTTPSRSYLREAAQVIDTFGMPHSSITLCFEKGLFLKISQKITTFAQIFLSEQLTVNN